MILSGRVHYLGTRQMRILGPRARDFGAPGGLILATRGCGFEASRMAPRQHPRMAKTEPQGATKPRNTRGSARMWGAGHAGASLLYGCTNLEVEKKVDFFLCRIWSHKFRSHGIRGGTLFWARGWSTIDQCCSPHRRPYTVSIRVAGFAQCVRAKPANKAFSIQKYAKI